MVDLGQKRWTLVHLFYALFFVAHGIDFFERIPFNQFLLIAFRLYDLHWQNNNVQPNLSVVYLIN